MRLVVIFLSLICLLPWALSLCNSHSWDNPCTSLINILQIPLFPHDQIQGRLNDCLVCSFWYHTYCTSTQELSRGRGIVGVLNRVRASPQLNQRPVCLYRRVGQSTSACCSASLRAWRHLPNNTVSIATRGPYQPYQSPIPFTRPPTSSCLRHSSQTEK